MNWPSILDRERTTKKFLPGSIRSSASVGCRTSASETAAGVAKDASAGQCDQPSRRVFDPVKGWRDDWRRL